MTAGLGCQLPTAPNVLLRQRHIEIGGPDIDYGALIASDTVYLTVKRIEPTAVTVVAEVELTSDLDGVDLPLDESGALYVVDWETSEGHVYKLVLRDGASDQPAASVAIHEYQGRGRFAFVGYRVE